MADGAATSVLSPTGDLSLTEGGAIAIRGRYRIVEMDRWEQEDLDLVGPAFIEFGPEDTGSFGFIAVEGWMDCRGGHRGNRPAVDFSWEGGDDGHPSTGRGWAVSEDDGALRGHLYFHLGDDSGFRAIPGDDLAGEDTARHSTS